MERRSFLKRLFGAASLPAAAAASKAAEGLSDAMEEEKPSEPQDKRDPVELCPVTPSDRARDLIMDKAWKPIEPNQGGFIGRGPVMVVADRGPEVFIPREPISSERGMRYQKFSGSTFQINVKAEDAGKMFSEASDRMIIDLIKKGYGK